jgi:myo-inositol 2-dehydrogenase / D-chiro-inositol 1-dehydrogenase
MGVTSVIITILWLRNLLYLPQIQSFQYKPVFSTMPPNQKIQEQADIVSTIATGEDNPRPRIRCAILGCGMMGQEHVSYIMGYPRDIQIDYLVDSFQPSLDAAQKVMSDYQAKGKGGEHDQFHVPLLLHSEEELFQEVDTIDLLVVATPNYLHTDSLVKWGKHDVTILVEKPVAVSREQLERLQDLVQDPEFKARVWTGMEYRFIPAIAKLLSLVPTVIGDLKMITIRENRYPFLDKVGTWNRDPAKTGDTLVEKCCHFFDLFRLITGQEVSLPQVRALAQRGLNYHEELSLPGVERPVIDAAYVVMPFQNSKNQANGTTESAEQRRTVDTIGCLELCMYAEGSRHQEEIIVTGTKVKFEQRGLYPTTVQVLQPILTMTSLCGVLRNRAAWKRIFRRTKSFRLKGHPRNSGMIAASHHLQVPSAVRSTIAQISKVSMVLRPVKRSPHMVDITIAVQLLNGIVCWLL